MKNKVRELRARHKMSQELLAKKAGTTRQTISAIEQGRKPSFSVAMNISNVFKVPVNEIFFGYNVTQELQKAE